MIEWDDGGPTSVDNGALLCRYHHRHHQQLGWHAEMINGRVGWIPPPFIDPSQAARFNTLHGPG